MQKAMQHNNHISDFFIGAGIAFSAYLKTFILQAQWPTPSEFFIKMITGVALAVAGGLVTWLFKDVYTVVLQPKFKKFLSKKFKRK